MGKWQQVPSSESGPRTGRFSSLCTSPKLYQGHGHLHGEHMGRRPDFRVDRAAESTGANREAFATWSIAHSVEKKEQKKAGQTPSPGPAAQHLVVMV